MVRSALRPSAAFRCLRETRAAERRCQETGSGCAPPHSETGGPQGPRLENGHDRSSGCEREFPRSPLLNSTGDATVRPRDTQRRVVSVGRELRLGKPAMFYSSLVTSSALRPSVALRDVPELHIDSRQRGLMLLHDTRDSFCCRPLGDGANEAVGVLPFQPPSLGLVQDDPLGVAAYRQKGLSRSEKMTRPKSSGAWKAGWGVRLADN